MRLQLFLLLAAVVACGSPQSLPYAIKATATAPTHEAIKGVTPYASITYTTTVNPSQTGKLILNSAAKSLQQSMTVPPLRYRVEARYALEQQQKLERHFRQTGKIDDGRQALDMLVVVSASDDLRDLRGKITAMLTSIFSTPVAFPATSDHENQELDWRVALVSADAGDSSCLIIDNQSDLQALVLDSFNFSDDERVIDKAAAALGLKETAICSDFPRSNSRLVILITSDKDHQCDMDNPLDGSGNLNTRGKQTSYYCGSSLTRFHNQLKQEHHQTNIRLYALLDSKSNCKQRRDTNICYNTNRKQASSSCQFTNPCYSRDDGYHYASANYRRANIFDLIRYVGESDYRKIVNDLKADINTLVDSDTTTPTNPTQNKNPFIARLALGVGYIASTVSVKIDDVELSPKYYRIDKRGYVHILGDVRKHFPEGSVAVVSYEAQRPYKQLRLMHQGGLRSLLVHGADDYEFIAKDGLLVFQEPLPLESELRITYEYDAINTDAVLHKAHVIDTTNIDDVECCLSSDCSNKLSCHLTDDGMISHARDQQFKGGLGFRTHYTFTNNVSEFSVPHNCDEESLFLQLGDTKCSDLDIVNDSVIKFTSQKAKDKCSVFNTYERDDDVELHYRYSRQDNYVLLQQSPDRGLQVTVNSVPQKSVDDYLISKERIKFTQPLPTDAEVVLTFTP